MSQEEKNTNKTSNTNTGKRSGNSKSTSKSTNSGKGSGSAKRSTKSTGSEPKHSASKSTAKSTKKPQEKPVESTAPSETAPKHADEKKTSGIKKLPIIISIIVVLLGAGGFAYANVLLNAPHEIINEDGALYCLDGHGDKMTSRWIDFEGSRYYAGEDGKLCADSIEQIEESSYCFAEDGSLLSGIFKFHDDIYSSEDSGKLIEAEGWEEHEENTYYNSGTGRLVSSKLMDLDGETYYLDPDGILQRDTVFTFDDSKFYADPDGKILKDQIVEHGGNNYYAGPDGAFVRDAFTPFGEDYLYINDDSTIAKAPFTLENGYELVPDPKTGIIPAKEYKISQSEYIYKGKGTYIKVNIAAQNMIFVKDGELLISSPIVSGKYGKFDTPKGEFDIRYKARNAQLKGEVTVKGEYDEEPLTEAERAKLIEANPGSEEGVPTTKKVP